MSYQESPTIDLVAEQAGVSKGTVSRALRNRGSISEKTRDRIFETARKLNYWPSSARQGNGLVRRGQIGLLAIGESQPRWANEPGSSYLHSMLESCRMVAEGKDNGLSVCRLSWEQVRQGKLPAAMRAGHLDGIVVRGWRRPELTEWLKSADIPCVLVDSDQIVSQVAQVQIENIQAMDKIVEHLVSCEVKNPATITGNMNHLNSQERLAGLQMALMRRGITLPESNIVLDHGYDEQSGARGVETLQQRGADYDALVCQNDLIALGALRTLYAAGIAVPSQIKVTGFDDMEFASMPEIGLTTIGGHAEQLGRMATKLLFEQLDGKDVSGVHLRVSGELIVRGRALKPADEKLLDETEYGNKQEPELVPA